MMAAAVAASSLVATSCIDETNPTSSVTDEQLNASSKATEALLWAMPAKMVDYNGALSSDYHYDWGNGTMMHMRDVMGDEYVVTESGYDWYDSWEFNYYLGSNYALCQLPWQTFYKQILAANCIVRAINVETASDLQKGMLGAGYAYRATNYLDAARMYEYLVNDGTDAINSDGNNVHGLTVPIVTDQTLEEDARNNPRVNHYKMFEFIMSDLDKAEEYTPLIEENSKAIPHLAVVYGLKARAYMWQASFIEEFKGTPGDGVPSDTTNASASALSAAEYYAKAAEYARKAIDLGENTPLSKEQWLDTSNGFNTAVSSWMFCMSLVKESDAVQTGIINWTSWCSNETTYGYASAGPIVKAAAAFYEGISDKDFRKLSFKAPAGSKLAGKEPILIDRETFDTYPDYASLKFRPGQGNTEDYNIGSAVDIPLMRIEEMYFIEAEATAHSNPAQGANLLRDFMTAYRYSDYDTRVESKEDVIAEIIKQKRIEFWGEGINYFDYKRLNLPVTRLYEGSNFSAKALFNTTTRPAWMNWVIVNNEGTNNEGVEKWNSPDPSDCYEHTLSDVKKRSNLFEKFAMPRGMKRYFNGELVKHPNRFSFSPNK